MSKKVAILQSNYIPWKGYFDLIAPLYERKYTHISVLNRAFIEAICGYLGIALILVGVVVVSRAA